MSMFGPFVPRTGMCRRLGDDDWERVSACCTHMTEVPPRTLVSRMGEPLDRSLLLVEGFVARHVPGPHRDIREMVALEIAGDFVDLHSFPVGSLDHDVTAVTHVSMAVFPHDLLREMIVASPGTGIALWGLTIIDAAIHRYWSFRVGGLRAMGRIANFLCEMEARLSLAGRADANGFALPLTQTDLAEACGMSPVHVNRVIRELREAGCCTFRDGQVLIHDASKLRQVGQFEPTFLSLGS